MFRLLKLAAFALLGYAAYEFVVGLLQIEGDKSRQSNAPDSGRAREPGPDAGRMNITGPGEGKPVTTTGFTGETASHRVGRGAVAR